MYSDKICLDKQTKKNSIKISPNINELAILGFLSIYTKDNGAALVIRYYICVFVCQG